MNPFILIVIAATYWVKIAFFHFKFRQRCVTSSDFAIEAVAVLSIIEDNILCAIDLNTRLNQKSFGGTIPEIPDSFGNTILAAFASDLFGKFLSAITARLLRR